MNNKWLRLSLVSFIGIVIGNFALGLLGSFGGAGAMNPLMSGTVMPGMPMAANMNMSAPMVSPGLADIHQQLTDIKTMMSIGLPTAVALGLINLLRSFR